MKLNLGCGDKKLSGFINVDNCKEVQPDILHDLNKFPFPFETGSVELIRMDHVLEHLENQVKVLKECYRILKPQGVLLIRCPHASYYLTHTNFYHSKVPSVASFAVFSRFYADDISFKIDSVKFRLLFANFLSGFFSRYSSFYEKFVAQFIPAEEFTVRLVKVD